MKKILTLTVSICLVFLLVGLLPIHGEEQIYDSVLRLHVLANSDSEQDQALKLCVRDRVIELSDKLCSNAGSLDAAAQIVLENMENIYDVAKAEITRLGYDYEVEIRLSREQYPRKTYASLCFPSGEYLSLQVLIGNAEGQNWWCVLYPPLCLDAASSYENNEDAFIAVGLTEQQYKIITETKNPTYRARFKILELLNSGK